MTASAVYATERSRLSSIAELATSPQLAGDLLPFAAVIAGAPLSEKARARLRLQMNSQNGIISDDQFHPDPYIQSRNAERTLNAAIVHADISRSYEEYLEIFDEFYADDLVGSSETMNEPLHGRERVRALLFSYLAPLHAMAEVGGVSISIRETTIPGDARDETHSAWTLELVGVSGRVCSVNWRTLRKWNESRVVLEHHYDYQQSGGPLTERDLRLDTPEPAEGFHRPS